MLAATCKRGHWIVGANAKRERSEGRWYYRCAACVRQNNRERMRRKRGSVKRYDLSERESTSPVFVLKRGAINGDLGQGATTPQSTGVRASCAIYNGSTGHRSAA